MSKAEDRATKKALETFPVLFGERMGYDKTNLQQEKRNAYEKGYHQAEKDLELTVDDIMKIDALLIDMWNSQSGNKYQEVLKRFKAQKGK